MMQPPQRSYGQSRSYGRSVRIEPRPLTAARGAAAQAPAISAAIASAAARGSAAAVIGRPQTMWLAPCGQRLGGASPRAA